MNQEKSPIILIKIAQKYVFLYKPDNAKYLTINNLPELLYGIYNIFRYINFLKE